MTGNKKCVLAVQVVILVLLTYVVIDTQGQVNVSNSPSFLVEPPSVVHFSNTNGSNITCQVNGIPKPNVTWVFSDGTRVSSVPGLRLISSDGRLQFPSFKPEDYRQDIHSVAYKCLVSNIHGTIISGDVQVRGAILQPYDVYVALSYTMKENIAVLRCHVPQFLQEYIEVISWILNDKLTINKTDITGNTTNFKYLMSPSGDLYVRSVGMDESKVEFRCKIRHLLSNEQRTSAVGKLHVTDPVGNVPPRILDKYPQEIVSSGDNVLIPCVAEGHPTPSVQWFVKEKTGQQTSIQRTNRIWQIPEGLVIKNATTDDNKIFVCIATNVIGNDKKETSITVIVPLKVTVNPSVAVTDVGQSVTLTCQVTGYPPAVNFVTMKDGRPLPDDVDTVVNDGSTIQLNIPSVKSIHKGVYQCFASNGKFSAQGKADLILGDSPPQFTSTFTEQILQPGSTTTLHCAVSATPTPQIFWFLDGSAVFNGIQATSTDDKITSWLNLTRIRSEDGGMYSCVAENKAGKIEHFARINVYGDLVARKRSKISVMAGDTIYLNCPVVGYPIESTTWIKDNIVLPSDLQQLVLQNGTLVISKVQRSTDAGYYVCVTRNRGQNATSGVELAILVSPKITPFTFQQDSSAVGAFARLYCLVYQGDLPIQLQWYKDGQIISSAGVSQKTVDDYSSILTIEKIRLTDAGNYTCAASNAAGTSTHTAQLTVSVPPQWTVEPQNTTVRKGSLTFIHCQADGFPKPNIHWTKVQGNNANGQRQPLLNREDLVILSNGTLQISNAKNEHQGFYFCSANNNVGKGLSKVIYLKIQAPVYFDIEDSEVRVKLGTVAEITCEAYGDQPINVVWKNEKRLVLQNRNKYKITTKMMNDSATTPSIISTLNIQAVTKADAEHYYCMGTNSYGTAVMTVKLIVQEIPANPEIVTVKNIGNRSVELVWTTPYDGNSAILKFVVQYKRKHDSWQSRSSFKNFSDFVTNGTIERLQPATVYEFRLGAENVIGLSSFSNVVTVSISEEAPEGPPQQVEVDPTDPNSLRISWRPPPKHLWNGAIRGYYIGYKIRGTDELFSYKIFEVPEDYTDNLVYQLSNLNMYTQYTIVVLAYNGGGKGPRSEEITAMTSEDVPKSAPENMRCSSLSARSIYVVWENLPLSEVNGLLLGYKVIYEANEDWSTDGTGGELWNMTQIPKLTLVNLDVNTNYSLQVLAYTKVGDGPRSASVFCKTYEDVPDAPDEIKALPSSAETVLIAWKAPKKKNSLITKYNVYYKLLGEGEEIPARYHNLNKDGSLNEEARQNVNVQTLESELTHFEFKKLDANRRYAFWVTATSVIGEGPSSKIQVASPLPNLIPAQSASFSDTIKVLWKEEILLSCRAVGIPPPKRTWMNGSRTLYDNNRLTIRFDGSLQILNSQREDSGIYRCLINNFHGNDEVQYNVIVDVPPQPPVLDVLAKSLNAIHLKWEAVTDEMDPMAGYVLYYKRDNGSWKEKIIKASMASYTLDNLTCGSTYFLYLKAYNSVGIGEPSDVISVTTQDTAFTMPAQQKLIREGATYVTISLESWPRRGCPLKYFSVQYKQESDSEFKEWTMKYQPSEKQFILSGLEPATRYNLRLTAHTSGEPNVADYVFSTTTITGVTVPPVVQKEEKILLFSADPWVVIPVIVLLITIIIAITVVCVFMKRRKNRWNSNNNPPPQWPQLATLDRTRPELGVSVESFIHMQRPGSTLGRHATLKRIRDDPNPYATVHIPIYPSPHEMNLLMSSEPPPIPPGPDISTLDRNQGWRYMGSEFEPEGPRNHLSWDQGYASADGENIYATTSRRIPPSINSPDFLTQARANEPTRETTFVFPNSPEMGGPFQGMVANDGIDLSNFYPATTST